MGKDGCFARSSKKLACDFRSIVENARAGVWQHGLKPTGIDLLPFLEARGIENRVVYCHYALAILLKVRENGLQ